MFESSRLIRGLVLAATLFGSASQVQGGPLLDWLFGRNRTCGWRGVSAPAYAAAPQTGCCQTTCMQTCQRVVVNYVPYTAYRTEWQQVPVTQYQTTQSLDPCTGCPVTCMRPCTSYTWQSKQVPYVTYRPVYRTESYSVPVTYSTPGPVYAPAATCNPCGTCNTWTSGGGCGSCGATPTTAGSGCSSCGVPVVSAMPAAPSWITPSGTYTLAPPPTISAPSSRSTIEGAPAWSLPAASEAAPSVLQPPPGGAAADQPPSLKPIILERREIPSTGTSSGGAPAPGIRALPDPNPEQRWDRQLPDAPREDLIAAVPTRQAWDYSPVRLASYTAPAAAPASREHVGNLQMVDRAHSSSQTGRVNAAWTSASW